jgi:hypothetical protein
MGFRKIGAFFLRVWKINVMPEQNLYFRILDIICDVTQYHWVNSSQLSGGLQRLHLRGLRHSLFLSSSDKIRDCYDLIKEELPSSLCFAGAARSASLRMSRPQHLTAILFCSFRPPIYFQHILKQRYNLLTESHGITTHNFS